MDASPAKTFVTPTDARLIAHDTGDEHARVLLDPAEAVRLVRRLRGVSLFVRINGELITAETADDETHRYRYFETSFNLKVTGRQAVKALGEFADKAERMAKRAEPVHGRVQVTRLGNCIFIG